MPVKEDPTRILRIYKEGVDTGKTIKLDLNDPKVREEIVKSLNKQDGEYD